MRKLDPGEIHHPAVVEQFNQRASDFQVRVADRSRRSRGP